MNPRTRSAPSRGIAPAPWCSHRLMLLALCLAALAFSAEAAAQTITKLNTGDDLIVRYEADTVLPARRDGSNRLTLRSAECLADANLVVRLNVMGPNSSYLLQAWAGSAGSCELDTDRTDTTTSLPRCWPLYSARNSQTELDLQIPVRRLLARERDGITKTYGPEVCDTTGDLQITLTFMHVDGSNQAVGTGTTLVIPTNTQGPPQPTNVSAASAENSLIVSWDVTAADNVDRYRLYCLPAEDDGTFATSGAALTSDAGLDAGGAQVTDSTNGSTGDGGAIDDPTPVDAPCDVSAFVVDGELSLTSAQRAAYLCQTASGTSGTVRTDKNLKNGQLYGVVVVALDESLNESALEVGACAIPDIVFEPYEVYDALGGSGGGGFFSCAVAAPSGSGSPWPPLAGLVLGAVALAHRRRGSRPPESIC